MKLGFIGAGQMATALAAGISSGGLATEILASDPDDEALRRFEDSLDLETVRFRRCDHNREVVQGAQYVFLAVKPQMAETALRGIDELAGESPVFVSIIAGKTIEKLQDMLGTNQVIRSMPNTPCLIGEGVIACTASEAVDDETLQVVSSLLEQVGVVLSVRENQMDAVTGLSGSGPAFVFKFIEAMSDAGVLAGLPRQTSELLAMRTVAGSVRLLETTGEHPAELRNRVTSPGGTTIHGLAELEKNAFANAVIAAVMAAAERSRQLSEPS